jgi:hypothetical protein
VAASLSQLMATQLSEAQHEEEEEEEEGHQQQHWQQQQQQQQPAPTPAARLRARCLASCFGQPYLAQGPAAISAQPFLAHSCLLCFCTRGERTLPARSLPPPSRSFRVATQP